MPILGFSTKRSRFSQSPKGTALVSTEKNVLSDDLLAILRCPRTGETLSWVPSVIVDELNRQIAAGEAHDASGEVVVGVLDAALMNESQNWCYPIRDSIPALIPDEAISLAK
jgi:uncharacterized protein YbaR (Trm112 family)